MREIPKGERNGTLTIIRELPRGYDSKGKSHRMILCQCDCGNTNEIRWSNWTRTTHCGRSCKADPRAHGMANTAIYRTWINMRARCNDPNHPAYPNYGGRGISVCRRWDQFVTFYKDMGNCPRGMSIDRVDNNGDYEPDNCQWATQKEQANNRRTNAPVTINGRTMNLYKWLKELGVADSTYYARRARGWSVEKSLTTTSEHG